MSTTKFLEELVRREPNTPERQRDTARFLEEEFARVIGEKGRVWSTKIEGDLAGEGGESYLVAFEIDGNREIYERLLLYAHYDVVERVEGYKDIEHIRQPNELYFDPENPKLVYGLGCQDMLGSIATIRQAVISIVNDMENGSLWPHRSIRGVFAYGEESESFGFAAAKDLGLFEEVDCCLSQEALVNYKLLKTPRAVGYGRLGRYGFKVVCNGYSGHTGENTKHIYDKTTVALDIAAKSFIAKQLELPPHSNPQAIMPDSDVKIKNWGSTTPESQTTTEQSSFDVVIHYADQNDTLGELVGRVRQGLKKIAAEAFPGDDPEDVKRRERAFEVIPEEHPYTFALPYKDDIHHPFHGKIRYFALDAYKKFVDPKDERHLDAIVSPIVDTGASDDNRLATETDIPVAIAFPVGGIDGNPKHTKFSSGYIHSAKERKYLPTTDEGAYIIERAAKEPREMAKWDQ